MTDPWASDEDIPNDAFVGNSVNNNSIDPNDPYQMDDPLSDKSLHSSLEPLDSSTFATSLSDNIPLQKEWSILRLCMLNSALFSVQCVFGVEFSFLAPMFSSLGVSPSIYSFIWIAGPVSGLIGQPVFGVLSDNFKSKYGKRRPWIFWGAIITALGLCLLAFAPQLGTLFGDRHGNHGYAIAIAVVSLWILNFSLNAIMTTTRCMIELLPPSQIQLSSALSAFFIAFASLAANGIGAINLLKVFPFFASQFQGVFLIVAVLLILFVIPTLLIEEPSSLDHSSLPVFVSVTPLGSPRTSFIDTPDSTIKSSTEAPSQLPTSFTESQAGITTEAHSILLVFQRIWDATRHMPPKLFKIVIVYFFSWFGLSPFFVFISSYTAQDVFHGDPSKVNHNGPTTNPAGVRYLDGLRFGVLCLTFQAALVMVYSPFIDTISKKIGVKLLYGISQLIFGISTILMLFFPEKTLTLILIILCGFMLSAINSIPFQLVGENFSGDLGLYMGILNFGSVTGQLISNFLAGLFIHLGKTIAAGITMGGIVSIIGVFFIPILPVNTIKGGYKAIDQNDLHDDDDIDDQDVTYL